METIITHPNFDYMWEELVKKHRNLKKWKVNFGEFADLWPNIFIENLSEDIEHKEVTYIWDFRDKSEFFTNYATIRALQWYYANKVRVIIPFFPVWTMERISKKWEVATSRYMADLLGTIPSGRTHKSSIHIFDLHSLEQRFFFDDDKINTELHTAMNLIKEKISPETIVVFPDAWARKRFEWDFLENESIHCLKKRDGDKREISIESDLEIKWKDFIIIDDLIQSWWTIVETAKKLKKLWARKVEAFATHWVFVKNALEELTKVLDKLYTTDSIPKNIETFKGFENAQVLSLRDTIYEKIIKII